MSDKILSVIGYDAAKDDVWPAMVLRFNRAPTEKEMNEIYSTVGGWLCGQWFDVLNKDRPVREGAG